MQTPLLQLDNLSVAFDTQRGPIVPVRDVSLTIFPGQTVAVVGESGCGKSVTALSILRLIPQPPGRIIGGRVLFEGRDLLGLSKRQMQHVRGKDIAMIFQEPMTSLNPVYTIGDQIVEAIKLHQHVGTRQAYEIAVQSLADVGISDPGRRVHEYPHQMSGGMRQRVMIAMALSCQPKLLIADEPTTALDVTIQAQILELLRKLQRERGMSVMLITHDLGVVAENADVVAVMYASRVVEFATVEDVFDHPRHPYTQGLLRSVPKLGASSERLATIAGTVPNPASFPGGCKFHPRCPVSRAAAEAAAETGRQETGRQETGDRETGDRETGDRETGRQETGDRQTPSGASAPKTSSAASPSSFILPPSSLTTQVRTLDETFRVVRICATEEPALRDVESNHWVACHLAENFAASPATAPVLEHRREVVAAAEDAGKVVAQELQT